MDFDRKPEAPSGRICRRRGGGAVRDPKFKRVADSIFDASGTRVAPYAGISDLPRRAAPRRSTGSAPDFGGLHVAVVGIPMDLGVTNRNGARFGPRAVRTIERIGPYNHVLESAPVFDLQSPTSATSPSAAASASRLRTRISSARSPQHRRGRRGAALRRRRSFHDAADPARRRAGPTRSAWSISTRTATRPAPST